MCDLQEHQTRNSIHCLNQAIIQNINVLFIYNLNIIKIKLKIKYEKHYRTFKMTFESVGNNFTGCPIIRAIKRKYNSGTRSTCCGNNHPKC